MSPRWNRTPWIIREDMDMPCRYRGLTPGAGWLVAYAAPNEQGEAEIYWEPVAAFAIARAPQEGGDDVVVPVVRYDRFGAELEPVNQQDTVLGLYTVAERADEPLMAELHQKAADRIRENLVRAEREAAQRATVDAFVQAQPDPEAFCTQMRAAGAPSLHQAWLAITLADGDAQRAIALTRAERSQPGSLYQLEQRRQERRD
jgi:hypothetical protein